MTYKEAILSQTAIFGKLPESAIEFQLARQGLDADDPYSEDKSKEFVNVIKGLILWVMSLPKSVSELDYSITMQDIDGLKEVFALLCDMYGIPDPFAPAITAYRGW